MMLARSLPSLSPDTAYPPRLRQAQLPSIFIVPSTVARAGGDAETLPARLDSLTSLQAGFCVFEACRFHFEEFRI